MYEIASHLSWWYGSVELRGVFMLDRYFMAAIYSGVPWIVPTFADDPLVKRSETQLRIPQYLLPSNIAFMGAASPVIWG